MRSIVSPRRQDGAVIITVALMLLFLLGFMGIALDFGRLFIVKTELQTAMDSCALAAAQELDGESAATARATSAGMTAASLNKLDLQGTAVDIPAAAVTFSDSLLGPFTETFDPASAKYARCAHASPGILPWLLQAMGAFTKDDSYKAARSVGAAAVATRAPSKISCVMPVGICQKNAANPLGFTRGEWIGGITNDQDDMEASGQFRWLDFSQNFPDGSGGARAIKDMLAGNGQCGLPGKETDIGKSGKSNGAVDAWNTRFGIYAGTYSASGATPDLTGYAWYEKSDVVPLEKQGRYDDPSENGFQSHRANHDPYQGDNKAPDTKDLKVHGSASDNETHENGANRRVIATAVIDCADMTVKGFACVLMLHPMERSANGKKAKMWLEFISDASASSNNPCITAGLAGGSGGALVPALVE